MGLLTLGLAAACSRGSDVHPKGGGTRFTPRDLHGAWLGLMTITGPPADAPGDRSPYNVYFRCDAQGVPTDGALATGFDWSLSSAVTSSIVLKDGRLLITITGTGNVNAIEMQGAFDRAVSMISGVYVIRRSGVLREEGDFQVVRSSGPGHFVQQDIAGDWDGEGYRIGMRQIILALDGGGVLLSGEMVGEHVFIPGSGTPFLLSDSEVGRFDNPTWDSTDGSVQSLRYVLLDDTRQHLGGPGNDSELGNGVMRLVRVP